MRGSLLVVSALGVLVACGPEPGGESDGASASAGAESTGGTSSEAVTTGEAEDGPTELGCEDMRWEFVMPESEVLGLGLTIGVGGRLWVLDHDQVIHQSFARELDGAETVVGEIEFGAGSAFFGGTDASGNLIVDWNADDVVPEMMRKYGPDRSLLWEVEIAPGFDYWRSRPVVAPEGWIVISRESTVARFDADGALEWEMPNAPNRELHITEINADGAMVAIEISPSRVSVLEADFSPRWSAARDNYTDRALIDGAGGALVTDNFGTLTRYAADGTVVWETPASALGLSSVWSVAMNPAGEVVVASLKEAPWSFVELDAAGKPAVVYACEDVRFVDVAIDEAGRVYAAGFRSGGGAVVRAFD